jgi:hypothetical protein
MSTALMSAPLHIALRLALDALARWIEPHGRRGSNRRTPSAA